MRFFSKIEKRLNTVPKSAQEWNEKLLFGILATILIFGSPALISSVKMAIDAKTHLNLVMYISCYLFGWALVLVPTIPYKIRAVFTILVVFSLGLLALKTLGPVGSGRIYLFTAAILTALLLGIRSTIYVLVGIFAVVIFFSAMLYSGSIKWDLAELYDFNAWKVTIITFLFLTTVCTVAVSLLIKGLRDMHDVIQKNSSELAETSRKLSDEVAEHQKTLSDLKRSRDQLLQSQKMEAIGALAGGIAHDFNNILVPIIGLADLLVEDFPIDSKEHQRATKIYEAGNRARDLVGQILAVSRQSEHQLAPVSFQLVLKEVFKLCRSSIPANIQLLDDIQRDCRPVLANPTQLHQIAMNLITNAFHAVKEINGEIKVSLREVAPSPVEHNPDNAQSGRHLLLTVSDNGTGMSKEVQEKIFDPYFTTKGLGEGTGLGLAVVYGIVKEYGGDIKVESQPGEGSVFEIIFPIKEKPSDVSSTPASQPITMGHEHILLVDDESATAVTEQLMLKRLGYTVTVKLSGLEALDEFKANPDNFDMVISDMAMPNITGDQLAAELKKIRPEIPIIICTGFSEKINMEKAAAIGVSGFLIKPVRKQDIAHMVREALDGKPAIH